MTKTTDDYPLRRFTFDDPDDVTTTTEDHSTPAQTDQDITAPTDPRNTAPNTAPDSAPADLNAPRDAHPVQDMPHDIITSNAARADDIPTADLGTFISPEAVLEHDHIGEALSKAQRPWRRLMVDAVSLRPGDNLLDIGCGVGDLTLDLQKSAPKNVSLTGLEADPAVLKTAQSRSTGVVWRFGDIADGLFENADFDAATSAFSLGRFTDPEDALAAARNALKRNGGRIIVAVWSAGPPGAVRRTLLDLMSRHTIPEVVRSYASQFSLGSTKELGAVANAAGFSDIMLQRRRETVKFRSLDAFIDIELRQMPLGDKVNPVQRAGLLAEARNHLHRRIKRDGKFIVPLDAVLLSARRL